MFTAYVVVTLLTVAYNIFSAVCDFILYKPILISMEKAGVPTSWLPWLGVLKAAGAIGLLIGFVVPAIGVAAIIGIILFFCGAIVVHLRVKDNGYGLAAFFLLLAAAALTLRLIAT